MHPQLRARFRLVAPLPRTVFLVPAILHKGMELLSNIDTHAIRADDLCYVVAVASSGTLVAAAAALGVDHTTVSRGSVG